MPERIIRDGELTAQSLLDAVVHERGEGRQPVQLAVGSQFLEARALQVLATADGSQLDALRPAIPNVIVDSGLGDDQWELR